MWPHRSQIPNPLQSVYHLSLFFSFFSSQKGTKYQDSQLRFLLSLPPVNKPALRFQIHLQRQLSVVNPDGGEAQGTLALMSASRLRQRAPGTISPPFPFLSLLVLLVAGRWTHSTPSQIFFTGLPSKPKQDFWEAYSFRKEHFKSGLVFAVCCQTFNPVSPNFLWVTTRLMFEKSHSAPPNKYVQRIFTNGDRNCLALLDSTQGGSSCKNSSFWKSQLFAALSRLTNVPRTSGWKPQARLLKMKITLRNATGGVEQVSI